MNKKLIKRVITIILVLICMTLYTAVTATAKINFSDDNIVYASNELIGEIYFKEISGVNNIIFDSEDNRYVKNQILLTAYDNISFEEVEKLVNDLNAEIVGYIELTNDYQIEFKNNLSNDELLNTVEMLSANPIFELVTPNIVIETVMCDEQEKPNKPIIEPLSEISKDNWSLHAINVIDVWQNYFGANSTVTTSTVKIGVIDGYIYTGHEDLQFADKSFEWNDSQKIGNNHGTRVAGIIGAKHNNFGISGICPKVELYGYSFMGNSIEGTEKYTNVMQYKFAIALMISNNVKVINISLGAIAFDNVKSGSEQMEKFLRKLLIKGYDFLIVNSTGNSGKDAIDNSFFTCIEPSSPVYDHIIVVGAVNYKKADGSTDDFIRDSDGNVILEYEYRMSSNYGDRVDIVAPGENIMSTSVDDKLKSTYEIIDGTSAAAPQVAGVAGLVYSVNPNLKASEVKNIIIESAKNSAATNTEREITRTAYDGNGDYTYYLLDAKAAVDMAKDMDTSVPYPPAPTIPILYGTVTKHGTVTKPDGDPAGGTQIYITSKTTGDEISFKTDEDGNYLINLIPDTYDISFIADDELMFNGYTGWENCSVYHYEKDKEIHFGEVYPLDVTLENNSIRKVDLILIRGLTLYDDDYSDVEISITNKDDGIPYTETINVGGFYYTGVKDGKYTISISKKGYETETLEVIAKDGVLYDENNAILTTIRLFPKESTITGAVLVYNSYTYDVMPKANHKISFYDENDTCVDSVFTDEKGKYEVKIKAIGEITVKFDDDKQETIYVNDGKYIVNACYVIGDYEDDNDDDGDNDNNDGNNDGSSNTHKGLPGLIYDYYDTLRREDRNYRVYYCSSINIIGPNNNGRYNVKAYYYKMGYKAKVDSEEVITLYDYSNIQNYWTDNPDGSRKSQPSDRVVMGGTLFPDGTIVNYLSLPDEIEELLEEGDIILFFEYNSVQDDMTPTLYTEEQE